MCACNTNAVLTSPVNPTSTFLEYHPLPICPLGERVCGVIWRLGEVGEDGVATAGHWLGATYEHSKEHLAQRRWFEKDSLASKKATAISFEALLVTIDSAERDHRDFLVILDLVE